MLDSNSTTPTNDGENNATEQPVDAVNAAKPAADGKPKETEAARRRREREERREEELKAQRAALGDVPETIVDYVRLFIQRHRIAPTSLNSLQWCPGDPTAKPEPLNLANIGAEMFTTAKRLHLDYRLNELMTVFSNWHVHQKDNITRATVAALRNPPAVPFDFRAAADLMFEETEEMTAEMNEAVLRELLYQIKRNCFNLPIRNHLMPVFVAGQGSGKTTTIRAMLEPIKALWEEVDFERMLDDRDHDLQRCKALFLDEMHGLSSANMGKLKQRITARKVGGRILYSNSGAGIDATTSFVGAADRTLRQIIFDNAGMRRFIELAYRNYPVDHPNREAHLAALNSLDWMAAFQTVDEMSEISPIEPFQRQLTVAQEAARIQSAVEQWFYALQHDYSAYREVKDHIGPERSSGIENGDIKISDIARWFDAWRQRELPNEQYIWDAQRVANELYNLKRIRNIEPFVKKRVTAGMRYTFVCEAPEAPKNSLGQRLQGIAGGKL